MDEELDGIEGGVEDWPVVGEAGGPDNGVGEELDGDIEQLGNDTFVDGPEEGMDEELDGIGFDEGEGATGLVEGDEHHWSYVHVHLVTVHAMDPVGRIERVLVLQSLVSRDSRYRWAGL